MRFTKKNVAVASLAVGAGLLTASLLLGGVADESRPVASKNPTAAKKAQTLVTKLAAAESDGEAKATKTALASAIRKDAALAREAGTLVANRRAAEVSEEVIEALVLAGTDESHEALLKIARDVNVATKLRARAVSALACFVEERSALELRRFAFSNEPELAQAALDGLGPLLADPELPERARVEALDELEGAALSGAAELSAPALEALAVAGAPRSRSVFLALATSGDEDVRASAVHGLRAYPGADSDAALANALSDPSSNVRAAAVLAARGRASAVDAVRALLERDQDDAVRAEAVRFFAARAGDAKARAAVLVATHDRSEAIRALAAAVLGG